MTRPTQSSRSQRTTQPQTPLQSAPGETIEQTAERLVGNCSEVRVRINWFSTSAKIDDDIAQGMLAGTDADSKAVSISKRLMSSKHDAMTAVKEARKALDDHIKAYTIPMLAIRLATAATEDGLTRKDAGIRLIEKDKMETFDERLKFLTGVLRSAADNLQRKMPEVKADDKERLGKLYKDDDYPTDVSKLIGAEVSYKPIGVDISWKTLCPAIYEREQVAAREKFAAVVECAATEFAVRFTSYCKQVVDQLGNRIRLNPVAAHTEVAINLPTTGDEFLIQNVNVKNAEVIEKMTSAEDADIPAGHVLLKLRLQKAEGARGKSSEVWTANPMTEAHYTMNLRPFESSTEKRKLYASTIDNLKAELEAFINLGSMLGPFQETMNGSIERVRELLTTASRTLDTDKIAKDLREGSYFRDRMKEVLKDVAVAVQSAVVETKRSRRSIRAHNIED